MRFLVGSFLALVLVAGDGFAHIPQIPLAYRHLFGGGGGMYMESMYLPPVTTGPWSPSWSPDGSEIVFAMQESVWRVSAEGGEAVELTSGPHYDGSPDWSPDGRRIAFTRDTGVAIDIWWVDAHTNPVYIIKGGESPSSPEDARYFLKWIERVLELLQESEDFDSPAQKQEVIDLWRRGREVYSVLAQ